MASGVTKSVLSTGEQLESIWHLGGLRPKQLMRRVWDSMNEDNIFGRAAELAYGFLLSIFPMLLFLVALFGLIAFRASGLQDRLFFYLSTVLPPMAYQVVFKTVHDVASNASGGKLTLGIVLALWSASGGMTSMISTLNGAYAVRDSRSYFKVRGIALALTLAISALVIAALLLVLVGGDAVTFLASHLALSELWIVGWRLIQWPAALFFISLAFAIVYYFGPNLHEQHWYWITPGSVVGVLLWVAVSFGLRAYLHFFNSYSKTYGSLGAVIILLLWFYVTGLAFLIGAEVNAQIEHAAARHGHPEAKFEGQKAA
jgi:membrane protein